MNKRQKKKQYKKNYGHNPPKNLTFSKAKEKEEETLRLKIFAVDLMARSCEKASGAFDELSALVKFVIN